MSAEKQKRFRLASSWPQSLDTLSTRDAVALETAALFIRMLCVHPDFCLSDADANPLLHFALRHDQDQPALSAVEQLVMATTIRQKFGLTEGPLSFDALVFSDLMHSTFWDKPELQFFDLYVKDGQDWVWIEPEEGVGRHSEITWNGEEELALRIDKLFGHKEGPDGSRRWVAAAMPHVFRVSFTPARAKHDFNALKSVMISGQHTAVGEEGGRLLLHKWDVRYVLVGVVRKMSGQQEFVRFYDEIGLYMVPPKLDGKLRLPYIADDWALGVTGCSYTLLYCRAGTAPRQLREFIPFAELEELENA
jgi:hypothetical protein